MQHRRSGLYRLSYISGKLQQKLLILAPGGVILNAPASESVNGFPLGFNPLSGCEGFNKPKTEIGYFELKLMIVERCKDSVLSSNFHYFFLWKIQTEHVNASGQVVS